MDKDVQEKFWKAFQASPFIMIKLESASGHSEPMTAILDKDAHHAIWFYCASGNRLVPGGPAMAQVVTKGHDVFACISGTIVAETDPAVFDAHWSNPVAAWFPNGKSEAVMLRFDIADAEVWTSELGLSGRLKLLTGSKIDEAEAGRHEVGAV